MICLVLVFVCGPGLIKFSFVGGKSNSNIFTNFFNFNEQVAGNSCI